MEKPPKGIPEGVAVEALKAGKYCYSQGRLSTLVDAVTMSDKNTDGSYKNPWNEEGREKIRDTCFDELVAPKIIKARGSDAEIEAVRTQAKAERTR